VIIPPDFDWKEVVEPYKKQDLLLAIGQIATSILPVLLGWSLMIWAWPRSLALFVLLAFPTAGFIMRTLIVGHDCGHHSFLASQRANVILGWIVGIFTLTPFQAWRRGHNIHHATSGNLDRRSDVDIYTFSVSEYLALSPFHRLAYRVYRHPVFLLAFVPLLKFFLLNRLWDARSTKPIRRAILLHNLVVALWFFGVGWFVGFGVWSATLSLSFLIAGSFGIYLFYVQHQFEEAYWKDRKGWDYVEAALFGSTYLKLPRWLNWFSGNIGFHHIHHLCPAIPNYHLEACHQAHPLFQQVKTVSFLEGLALFRYKLWDEEKGRMVGFPKSEKKRSGFPKKEQI
jgi:omega-6 fatty acid desaturase (delta-12 desaturase)